MHLIYSAIVKWIACLLLSRETLSLPYTVSMRRGFNSSLSSEDNFASENYILAGKYANYRTGLDYSYHKYYSEQRQHLHDGIIDQIRSRFMITEQHMQRRKSPHQWILFTAGAMGCGKSFILELLQGSGAFQPLHNLVRVDPDEIRELIPEYHVYNSINASTAGILTQKEVGYVSEVLVNVSLYNGHSIIVDGSLQDHEWYKEYFFQLRRLHPLLRIGIIEVRASLQTCLSRAASRAQLTDRRVPHVIIKDAHIKIPISVSKLKPLTNFTCTIINEDGYDFLPEDSDDACSLAGFSSAWMPGAERSHARSEEEL